MYREQFLKTICDLEQKKEYMDYEVDFPVHIDDYLNIDTHDS